MISPNTKIGIVAWGSISALGGTKEDIIKQYNSPSHCLTQRTFNGKLYPVGQIPSREEQILQHLLSSDKRYKRLDRSVLLALIAARQLIPYLNTKEHIAVNIGSSRGATHLWEEFYDTYLKGPTHQAPLLTSPLTTLGNLSSEVAHELGIQGFTMNHSTTCSTTLQALANGYAWLKADMVDAFIAGGSEAPLTPFTLAQTEALGIYTTSTNTYPSRPFSSEENKKNMFTLGEGAALFLLKKGVEEPNRPYLATIEGIGNAFEPPPSATGLNTNGEVLLKAMEMAIKDTPKEEIDAIITHGTGTIKGDLAEENAIKKLFPTKTPILFSNKWKLGHTYGASGGLSIELALLLLQEKCVPHIPYPHTLDSLCQKNISLRKILINTTGFGGNAASILLSK